MAEAWGGGSRPGLGQRRARVLASDSRGSACAGVSHGLSGRGACVSAPQLLLLGLLRPRRQLPFSCCQKAGRKVSKWLFSSDHTPEVHLLNAGRLGHTSVHSKGAPWRAQLR